MPNATHIALLLPALLITGFALHSGHSRAGLPARDQAPAAATPAEERFLKWLEVYNRGDHDALLAYHESAGTKTETARRALNNYRTSRMTGGFEPHRMETTPQGEVRMLGRERLSGIWVNLTARFSPQPPNAVAQVGFGPADPPAEKRPKEKPSPEQVVKRMEEALDRLGRAEVFSGAVLVAKDGKPIFKKAYGLASRAYAARNRIDTKFNLASMGKMFTGVAVAQLAQEGKLSLNDTVGKWLPDYPNKAIADKVTVKHLLTHTGGIGSDMFNEKYRLGAKERFRTIQDFIPLFADAPPNFEPGSRWAYSNAGYVLLGAIIEKASGKEYWTYLKERIFDPAGMVNTGAFEMDHDTPNLAIGYTALMARTPEEVRNPQNNVYMHVVKGSPAGGSFSTVEDLLKFANALREHRLLSAEYTEMVMRGQVDAGRPGSKYGFGFQEEFRNGVRIVGHSGGFNGISTGMDIYPESGYTVIALSNYDTVGQIPGFVAQEMLCF